MSRGKGTSRRPGDAAHDEIADPAHVAIELIDGADGEVNGERDGGDGPDERQRVADEMGHGEALGQGAGATEPRGRPGDRG